MTEEEFEAIWAALNAHLVEVRPIFDAFCLRHGFTYVNRQSIGRYPRVRIQKVGATTIWFDLMMEFDDRGQRFERFRRDLPYELGAGATSDLQDGSEFGTRFQKAIQCFSGVPFEQVGASLQAEMEKHLPVIEQWDTQYLKDYGRKIILRGSPG